ncbi:unnamed protein product, partial [Onchocerca flexuosa]|uniref:Calponin homology domain-containing protein DDB_G0272472-like n=1 Tax=Onchocerca flexuosa TaxID=387005 RepID=A0A183I3D7_9BILA
MEQPKEEMVEEVKLKEKIVEDRKKKAEVKIEQPKEEMIEEVKTKEKIVEDKKKKAEVKMEKPKEKIVEAMKPKEKTVEDKKKAEAKMEQSKEEMVEEVKPKDKTVEDKKKAEAKMEQPKEEMVEEVKSKEKIVEDKKKKAEVKMEKPKEETVEEEKMERPIREKHSEEIPVETVSVSFEFTKQRTQKIGVGTIFNSERPTEQIELTEEIKRRSPRGDAVQVLTVGEKCSACTSFCISAADINKTVSDIPKKNLKDSSISVIADIEVDSGEEIATTDAIVDVLKMFEETELVITDFASDIFDVDVTLDALMEEEFIEAIGPVFHNQLASLVVQMSTAVVAISRLIEETKILSANAEAEISMSVATETEIQELNLKLQKAGHESLKNFEIEEKLKDAEKESQKTDKEEKEKPKEEAEKRKKKVPKALTIPAEISSKYGDKSTILSETTITTEIAMNEETAEIETLPKKSLFASVAIKVDSTKSRKTVKRREFSVEEFTSKDEAGKEVFEERKKSLEELEKSETNRLTIEDEKKEAYERARKRRTGFIQTPDKEIVAFRGDIIKIECELVNEDDDFTWLINDKPANEDSRCKEEVNLFIRTLKITNIAPEDEGTIIIAKVGDIIAETIIHVEDTPAEIIEPLPRRSFGKCGEDVTLAVSVTHPAHSIIWEFDGEELSKDQTSYVVTEEGNFYTLTIKNATYDHAGRYSVKVDSLKTSTMLIMQGLPIIEKQEPESVNFEVHENLLLNIPYKAVPEPTVECFFNNEPLLVGTKLQLDIINDMVQFCKRKTNKNDSGEYTFKISNEFGQATKTFTVNVKDVPDVPENPRIIDVSSDIVSVAWDAPKDDGGSKIIGYVIEKKEISRRTFHHVIQVTDAKTKCLIEDLDADTEYIFRVAAINKYGTGEFSEFPAVHTTPAAEESELEKILPEEISSEEILSEEILSKEIISEEIPQEKELEKISDKVDEEQELIEPKKPKAKKAVKKDRSKKTEPPEEVMERITSEEVAAKETTS